MNLHEKLRLQTLPNLWSPWVVSETTSSVSGLIEYTKKSSLIQASPDLPKSPLPGASSSLWNALGILITAHFLTTNYIRDTVLSYVIAFYLHKTFRRQRLSFPFYRGRNKISQCLSNLPKVTDQLIKKPAPLSQAPAFIF